MKINELESILKFSSTDKKMPIFVNITYGNGAIEHCEIDSFATYTDGIVLNIKTDFGSKAKK